MLARDGRQSAFVTNAFLNVIPSRAIRSMFGVRRMGLPIKLNSSQRNPSPRKKTKLGLREGEVLSAARLPSDPCPSVKPPRALAPILRNVRRDEPSLCGGFDVIFKKNEELQALRQDEVLNS